MMMQAVLEVELVFLNFSFLEVSKIPSIKNYQLRHTAVVTCYNLSIY